MRKIKKFRRLKKHPILGLRFFDGGEYGMGFFTIKAVWTYKNYCKSAETISGSHWFSRTVMLVRTDDGVWFFLPYCPWLKYSCGNKMMSDYFNEHPFGLSD